MVTNQARVFRAIADPRRRQILGLLRRRRRTVGEIAAHFRCSRPAISRHLRVLRAAGLVAAERRGAARVCRLKPEPLRVVRDWLGDYEAFWSESLAQLKSHLENPQ